MRILITGDRNWFKKSYIREVLSWFDPAQDVIIHGGANGADSLAGVVAKELGFPETSIEVYPAQWATFHKAAGAIRNTQMLEEGQPDICFGFHPDLSSSKGTKDMVKKTCKAGVPTLVYS